MKNFALLTLFWLLFINAFAQSKKNMDSLHVVLSGFSVQKKSFTVDTTLIRVYCELSKEYIKLKNDSAIHYLQKALIVSKKHNYQKGILKSYIQFGRYYFMQLSTTRAMEYWFKALAIAEQLKAPNDKRFIIDRLGSCYMVMQDYDKALNYFKKYSDLCKFSGSDEDYLMSLNNIGVLFFSKKDYVRALGYYNLIDSLNRTINNHRAQVAALINIGKTQVILNNHEEALKKFKLAIDIEDNYPDRLSYVNNEIARVYLLLNKPKEALLYAKLSLKNAAAANAEMNGELAKTFSDIHEKLGNVGLAYSFYKQYSEIRLSEDSLKSHQLLRLVQLDYENEKSIERLAKLSIELKERQINSRLQRLERIGLLLLLVAIIIIAVYTESLSKKNKLIETQKVDIQKLNGSLENKVAERTEELIEANTQLKRKNDEIREALLKGQTMERERVASDLHDKVGSTLSALKWRFEALDKESLSEKEQKVYEGILKNMHKAYGEIRLISHNMLPAEFEEEGLIGALEKYLKDLNASSSKTNFKLDTAHLRKSIRQEVALEIYICCFETINNIIKHADATEVVIDLKEKPNGDLEVNIEDNGKGFNPDLANNGKGLKNVSTRAARVNAKLEISSKRHKGAKVTFRIPELLWEDANSLLGV